MRIDINATQRKAAIGAPGPVSNFEVGILRTVIVRNSMLGIENCMH